MHIIDRPRLVSRETYEALIEKIHNTLLQNNEVASIYQVGSIGHPGISDLDLVCIFKGEAEVKTNIRDGLNTDELYILTHNLFGIKKSALEQSFQYSFYTGYRHVGGASLDIPQEPTSLIDTGLKRQIALEFMLKMYISMYTQLTYGTIKLRAFLLEAKAIAFDLSLLGIQEHILKDQVSQVNHWRDQWFNNQPSNREIATLFKSFFESLEQVLSEKLADEKFYLPYEQTATSRNILINQGEVLKRKHRGFPLFSWLPWMNRKLLNAQNRFNSFTIELPYRTDFEGTAHERRFQFYEQLWDDNKLRYPHFIPTTTGIRLWRPEDFT
jgi:hypothetical protein